MSWKKVAGTLVRKQISGEKKEVALGGKQEPWCQADMGLSPAEPTCMGYAIASPLILVFFILWAGWHLPHRES